MFTGIIQASVPVVGVIKQKDLISFTLEFPVDLIDSLKVGASVALDGVCMSVTKIKDQQVSFDAMDETLLKTTIKNLKQDQLVNIERSAKLGDEIGGHIMSGHIIGTAEITKVDRTDNNCNLTFQVPQAWMKYLAEKGFIGLHGASLTLVDVDKTAGTFKVHLIPETLKITNFDELKVGDQVNIELDSRSQLIVDTVEEYLKNKAQ